MSARAHLLPVAALAAVLALVPAAPAPAGATSPATPTAVPAPIQARKHTAAISVVGIPATRRAARPACTTYRVHPFLHDKTTGRTIVGALVTATVVPDSGPRRVLGRARTDTRGRVSFVLPARFSGRLTTTWTGDRTRTNAVGRYEQHTTRVATVGTGFGGRA